MLSCIAVHLVRLQQAGCSPVILGARGYVVAAVDNRIVASGIIGATTTGDGAYAGRVVIGATADARAQAQRTIQIAPANAG